MLLTADWHLDDNPQNAYRWRIFDHVAEWVKAQKKQPFVYILGDITDRKDRHSGALVNRLVNAFKNQLQHDVIIQIIMGNHDKPINGTPFWEFLNAIDPDLTFYTRPNIKNGLAQLPYEHDPASAWVGVDLKGCTAAFIHQTVTGVKTNNGTILENPKMVKFPKSLKVYSGDIHTTQQIGNVKYVGAPHPVAFGDDYPPQMLELDDGYNITKTIKVPTIRKLMLRVPDLNTLAKIKTSPFDQARVVCSLPLREVDRWPAMQDAIVAWGKELEIELFSIEPDITGVHLAAADAQSSEVETDPEHILRMFAEAEEIDDRMLQAGIDLLKEII